MQLGSCAPESPYRANAITDQEYNTAACHRTNRGQVRDADCPRDWNRRFFVSVSFGRFCQDGTLTNRLSRRLVTRTNSRPGRLATRMTRIGFIRCLRADSALDASACAPRAIAKLMPRVPQSLRNTAKRRRRMEPRRRTHFDWAGVAAQLADAVLKSPAAEYPSGHSVPARTQTRGEHTWRRCVFVDPGSVPSGAGCRSCEKSTANKAAA